MNARLVFISILFFTLTTACNQSNSQETSSGEVKETQTRIIAEGATLKQVASDYSFTEGPAVDSEGNVFFTDQPNNKIIKWSVDGSLSTYLDSAGRANGMYFDHEGNLIACADLNNQLWKIDKDKNVEVLVNDFEGKKLNGPNDLWIDLDGGIYFTDPYYKRDYWTDTTRELSSENVYYLTPDKEKVMVVVDDFVQPNGIIGTPDGQQLYISDIGAQKTYSYQI